MRKQLTDTPDHPCMSSHAHHGIARIHLPVAPLCNIHCRYCERKKNVDTHHIQRPGVCEKILTPHQAVNEAESFLNMWGHHSIIGIAGPGDPLANPETFDTLERLNQALSNARLCLCTNGLRLPHSVTTLKRLGVKFVSVTVNSLDPMISSRIYTWVSDNNKRYTGLEAAKLLIDRQIEGIQKAIAAGIYVKINTVAMAGINLDHIPHIAEVMSGLGAGLINVMPLMPGGSFSHMTAPDSCEMTDLYTRCNTYMNVFTSCKQCRADAQGIPGKERCS